MIEAFHTAEALLRAEHATTLALAIANCHPDDAARIMTAALEKIEQGMPPGDDGFLLSHVAEDARFWADVAAPHEVVAYGTAALDALHRVELGLHTRKRLFWRLWRSLKDEERRAAFAEMWNALPADDRRAFLRRATGGR